MSEKHSSVDPELGFSPPTLFTRIREVVDYLFYLVYGVIGVVIVLELAGASDASGFKRFLNKLTYPLLGGFVGLFPDPVIFERHRLRISFIAAICVYMLLHVAVYGLLRLIDWKRWRFH
ncbi:MAG: hypothetical protein AB1898_23170 [Acidobacteriota bacterium]